LNIRENFLNTIEFKNPEWIPCTIGISPRYNSRFGKELEKIKEKYSIIWERDAGLHNSLVFQGIGPGWKKGYFTDSWGCVWHNDNEGLEGVVVGHPLSDWSSLKDYRPPDPLATRPNEFGGGVFDWGKIAQDIKEQKKNKNLVWGCGERLFDRMYFLRGFTNLMMDFATEDKNLPLLIEMLFDYEKKLVKKWVSLGIDAIWFHTDIATQEALMISPHHFRKYLKPAYKELFGICRNAGTHVYLSTDGRVLEILDDFIDCAVSMQDPQLGAIKLEEVQRHYKGRICIYLDLEMQKFPFCSTDEIDKMIKDAVDMLASPRGGLMLWAGIYDDIVPIENLEAICKAFIKYCF